MKWMMAAASLVAVLGPLGSSGCYLQNCPLFGKRNPRELGTGETGEGPLRSCASCGPGGAGWCVGEATCCWEAGCVMGLGQRETLPCRLEGLRSDPCQPVGRGCKLSELSRAGTCAADGLCCANDACEAQPACRRLRSAAP